MSEREVFMPKLSVWALQTIGVCLSVHYHFCKRNNSRTNWSELDVGPKWKPWIVICVFDNINSINLIRSIAGRFQNYAFFSDNVLKTNRLRDAMACLIEAYDLKMFILLIEIDVLISISSQAYQKYLLIVQAISRLRIDIETWCWTWSVHVSFDIFNERLFDYNI